MTLSIKNGGYAFLIRLNLMLFMLLWKKLQLLQILNDLSTKHLIKLILYDNDVKLLKFKGTVKSQTKWGWPNFSGLTIFEFVNQYKVTFFSERTCPNFPTSLTKQNICTSLWFCITERPKKYLLSSAWHWELHGTGPKFFVIW